MGLMPGAPSIGRAVWAGVLVVLLLFGGIGLAVALEWMMRGEPSEQFTRRRWFELRRPSRPSSSS
jgi:hypothetical protein